ncbi:ESX secretion-associated protein EspG [Mycobacteroides sp. LB1]|uniref:ESX secretion-associated protein EspG n=1 Tax=Mycobacteroides sp. LB1 TaxID=2750814 RepID=UPI0015DEC339|nr:ESX secretion-associated protein EspG [Mycobacteroides sp. LB1]
MTTALRSEVRLTDDELQVVASRIGAQGFPTVLAVRPRYATQPSLDAAFDAATTDLTDDGLIVDGLVVPELIELVRALQRPDREFAVRFVTPDGTARISVVRKGNRSVLARRIGNEILLRELESGGEMRIAVQAMLGQLPAAEPAQLEPVGAPIDVLSTALNGTHDAAALSDTIRALGTDQRNAMLLGSALASRQAFGEIVYYTLDVDDRIVRASAAVGVFYTKRGRLVSAPSLSPSGQVWATLKGGSNHSVSQAICQLVELLPGGWEGDR